MLNMLLLPGEVEQKSKEHIERLLLNYKKEKDESKLEDLIRHYAGIVYYLARKFKSYKNKEDLEQVGFLGLVQAIRRFDPSLKKDFLSFAIPTILGEMKRYLRDSSWDIKVPRRLQELGLKIQKSVDRLSQELGRTPKYSEIAHELGITEEEAMEAMSAGASYDALSLDTAFNDDDEKSRPLNEIASFNSYDKENEDERLFLKTALEKLPGNERQVIKWRFYDHLPQADIAKKLGVSQVQVSRLQRRALSRIKKELLNV